MEEHCNEVTPCNEINTPKLLGSQLIFKFGRFNVLPPLTEHHSLCNDLVRIYRFSIIFKLYSPCYPVNITLYKTEKIQVQDELFTKRKTNK